VVKQNFLDIFKVTLRLDRLGGESIDLGMPQDHEKPGVFAQAIGPDLAQDLYDLVVEVDGNTFQRQHKQTFAVVEPEPIPEVIDPIPEPGPEPVEAAPEPAPEPVPEAIEPPFIEPPIPEPIVVPAPEVQPEPEAEPEEEPPLHWAIIAGIILGINLLIGGLGFFGYKTFKARQAAAEQQLIDKLEG